MPGLGNWRVNARRIAQHHAGDGHLVLSAIAAPASASFLC